jgi:hypothetical protein
MTRQTIIKIDKIIMVSLDDHGKPSAHGKTKIEYPHDRFPEG